MENYFNCFNCKELIDIVFESKCCGKLYCHNCKIKLMNTHCLKCDKILELQRNIFAQRLLKNINVRCKYGCGLISSYDKMKEHLLICDKKIYNCSWDNLKKNQISNINNFKGYKKDISEHMKNKHPKILIFFMENYKVFENGINKILNKNIDKMNDDTILNISNNLNNLNDSLLINDENYTRKILVNGDIKPVSEEVLMNVLLEFTKPENIVFLTKEPDSQIKIIDFGLSKIFGEIKPIMKGNKIEKNII